jgi:hypothetical protein
MIMFQRARGIIFRVLRTFRGKERRQLMKNLYSQTITIQEKT